MRIRITDKAGREVLSIEISDDFIVTVEETPGGVRIRQVEAPEQIEPVPEYKVVEARERIKEAISDREAVSREIHEELEVLLRSEGTSAEAGSEVKKEEEVEAKPETSKGAEEKPAGEPVSDEEFLEEDFEKAKELAEKLKQGKVPEYKPQAVPKKSSKEDKTREILRSILDYTP